MKIYQIFKHSGDKIWLCFSCLDEATATMAFKEAGTVYYLDKGVSLTLHVNPIANGFNLEEKDAMFINLGGTK